MDIYNDLTNEKDIATYMATRNTTNIFAKAANKTLFDKMQRALLQEANHEQPTTVLMGALATRQEKDFNFIINKG